MKVFLLLFIFSLNLYAAKPIDKMNQRLKTYGEDDHALCKSNNVSSLSDDGLYIDVSCEFQCKGSESKRSERVKESFIPKKLGLLPGNGSHAQNTIWGSLGSTLKVWSQKICMKKAALGCKGLLQVENSNVNGLVSGEWKLDNFPSCTQVGNVYSPFGNDVKSNRISNVMMLVEPPSKVNSQLYEVQDLKLPTHQFPPQSIAWPAVSKDCKSKVRLDLCYGDCLDMNAADKGIHETLATNQPLGKDSLEVCGDEFAKQISGLKLSDSVKHQLCENYFLESLTKSSFMAKTCAALRGTITCENI